MDRETELARVLELARILSEAEQALRPGRLMDELRLTHGWESSKSQALVFRAVDLGMLKLTPTYHIIPG